MCVCFAGYAHELCAEFHKENNGLALAHTNRNLSDFFNKLSEGAPAHLPKVSNMHNLNEWIQSMSITGELHDGVFMFHNCVKFTQWWIRSVCSVLMLSGCISVVVKI